MWDVRRKTGYRGPMHDRITQPVDTVFRVVDGDIDSPLFPRLTTLVALGLDFGSFGPCYSHHSLNP